MWTIRRDNKKEIIDNDHFFLLIYMLYNKTQANVNNKLAFPNDYVYIINILQ